MWGWGQKSRGKSLNFKTCHGLWRLRKVRNASLGVIGQETPWQKAARGFFASASRQPGFPWQVTRPKMPETELLREGGKSFN